MFSTELAMSPGQGGHQLRRFAMSRPAQHPQHFLQTDLNHLFEENAVEKFSKSVFKKYWDLLFKKSWDQQYLWVEKHESFSIDNPKSAMALSDAPQNPINLIGFWTQWTQFPLLPFPDKPNNPTIILLALCPMISVCPWHLYEKSSFHHHINYGKHTFLIEKQSTNVEFSIAILD